MSKYHVDEIMQAIKSELKDSGHDHEPGDTCDCMVCTAFQEFQTSPIAQRIVINIIAQVAMDGDPVLSIFSAMAIGFEIGHRSATTAQLSEMESR